MTAPQKKHTWKFILIGLLLVLLLFFGLVYMSVFAKTNRASSLLVVDQGDTYQSLLIKRKWQTNPFALSPLARLYVKVHATKPLQKGAYKIPANASLHEVIAILSQGAKTAMIKIQLIEGKTTKQLYHTLKTTEGVKLEILEANTPDTWEQVKLDNQKILSALKFNTKDFGENFNGNLEGLFAPDTYYFANGTSDKTILTKLYQTQQKTLNTAWQQKMDNLPYKNPYEMLIMASIIEKETGLADEQDKVSAVFINRMRQNMRLQTDPTIIYGLFDRYDGKIYRSNIDEKTDYNTYQIDGLPPTPIAMPSKAAIIAAAHPANTKDLFFVATGKGGHKFSQTLAQHNQAVAEYRRIIANK